LKAINRSTLLTRSVLVQAAVSAILWASLALYLYATPSNWDPRISVASFVAVPAAVIGITQLVITAQVQRASYIKDYAIRFRTDKELSESFHYLVYRFDNTSYEAFLKKVKTPEEEQALKEAQHGLVPELCFFDPKAAPGAPQERRLDNLLGFFDTVGYDLSRGLLHERDIAGVFGLHLDHLIQRRVVRDYLAYVKENWPNLRSFHEQYSAPVPFRYLRRLLRTYVEFRNAENRNAADRED
jgi:hypothetical protein